jgi:outer membrane protein assembly factor BamB
MPGVCFAVLLSLAPAGRADDWPMLGHDRTRNPVSLEKGAPIEWDVKTGKNIKWRAPLGSITASDPVLSDGLIWIGTNNDPPHDPAVTDPGGILACFREADGRFLYQHVSTVKEGVSPLRRRTEFGMTGSPLAERDRLWFVSTMAEIVCLDTGLLRRGEGLAIPRWHLDMVSRLGVYPAVDIMGGKGMCSLGAAYGDYIYVITGNGVDWTRSNVPSPSAPALVCLSKNTGEVVWMDNSPGTDIFLGEYASPLIVEVGGIAQVIAPQGDGWVRSFEAKTGKLLWKFDINPEATQPRHSRNFFLNSPVFHEGRVYVAGGRDVESGEGPGQLVCLDPTRQGHLLWHYGGLGRTMSNPAIHDGLVIAVDFSGLVHCLDAKTGARFWRHDVKAHVWASPLIVDGKVYVANEDGIVVILALARELKEIARQSFEVPLYSSPIFSNGTLYLAAGNELFAIKEGFVTPPTP